MTPAITFCATSKSGLGHLRRLTNVGGALRARHPSVALELLTNAAVAGLSDPEIGIYRRIEVIERERMAEALAARPGGGPVVVDTAVVPGLHRVPGPLCLVLRETVAPQLERFRLEDHRPWDLIILPNPPGEWRPDPAAIAARRVEAVGWIWRTPGHAESDTGGVDPAATPVMLIASGGGGTGETARHVRGEVERLIRGLRRILPGPVEILQTLGPRGSAAARIDGVDRVAEVGAELHRAFAGASLIVSTAGYNSVLEIACTGVPALLLPIPRSLDDQQARARRWGGRLGHCHDPADPEVSLRWMAEVLENGLRRPPVDLGPPGGDAAAALLAELLA